jgi:predicted ATP-binding protein involved in virulence
LIGENGSGKSSVLLALAQLLRKVVDRGVYIKSDQILNEGDNRIDGAKNNHGWTVSACLAVGSRELWRVSDIRGNQSEDLAGIDHKHDLITYYDVRRQFKRGSWQDEYEPEPDARRGAAYVGWLDAGVAPRVV